MTEQQIREGYQQLDSALAPPLDAHERLAHRVRQRRQRRRAAVAGVAAVGVVAAGGVTMALTGDGATPQVAVDPPTGVTSTLELTRPDGSTYSFPDVTVSCEPPGTAAGDPISSGKGRIWLYSPIQLEEEDVEHEDDAVLQQPFVYLEGIVAKLEGDRTFTLPVDGPGDSDSYPLTLFVADTEGSESGNEVSSASGGSGTVRVLRAACEPTPLLQLEVDATLDSEEGLQSLVLTGTVR